LCEVPEVNAIIRVCTEAAAFVGVELDILVKLLPTIENDIEELADALRIDVIPSSVYALVAKTVHEKLVPVNA
jgi:hypothetical protein